MNVKNVLLDVLQRREPHYAASAQVLAAVEQARLEGWLAAHHVTTLFYLYARFVSPQAARNALVQLFGLLRIAPVDQEVVERALSLPLQDYEDAVAVAAGLQVGATFVVTRNPADFAGGPLPPIASAELLALLG